MARAAKRRLLNEPVAGSREGVARLCCCEQCMSVNGFWSAYCMIVSISPILVLESSMRLTIDVDDESLTRAAALTGMDDQAALIRCALELLVRIESGRQLCALGGSDRDAVAAPRRRV